MNLGMSANLHEFTAAKHGLHATPWVADVAVGATTKILAGEPIKAFNGRWS